MGGEGAREGEGELEESEKRVCGGDAVGEGKGAGDELTGAGWEGRGDECRWSGKKK